jgi:hypothetical protein
MVLNTILEISEETNKPYLILEDFYKDYDGEETITIESDGVGLVQGDCSMDLPITYYDIDNKIVNTILKNGGKCMIKTENNKIKRFNDKVIIIY